MIRDNSEYKNSMQIVALYFLIAAFVSSIINFNIMYSLRPNDIFLIIGFSLSIFISINIRVLVYYVIFMMIIFTSIFINSQDYNDIISNRVIFIYKYTLIFMVIQCCTALIINKSDGFTIDIWACVLFIASLIWSISYPALFSMGLLNYGSARSSFPTMSSLSTSDAHAYASFLTTLLIYNYYLMKKYNWNYVVGTIVLSLGFYGILLTGSRNGLLAICAFFVIYSILQFIHRRDSISWLVGELKDIPIFACGGILIHLAVSFVASMMNSDVSNAVTHITAVERAVHISLSEPSILERIYNLQGGIQEVLNSSLFFGRGIIDSDRIWYDGILTILLVHVGLLGILIIIIALIELLKIYPIRRHSWQHLFAFSLFCSYGASNVATEFVLISRSAIPSIVLIVALFISADCAMNKCKGIGKRTSAT